MTLRIFIKILGLALLEYVPCFMLLLLVLFTVVVQLLLLLLLYQLSVGQ
jgi:hypothetical protein